MPEQGLPILTHLSQSGDANAMAAAILEAHHGADRALWFAREAGRDNNAVNHPKTEYGVLYSLLWFELLNSSKQERVIFSRSLFLHRLCAPLVTTCGPSSTLPLSRRSGAALTAAQAHRPRHTLAPLLAAVGPPPEGRRAPTSLPALRDSAVRRRREFRRW